MKKRIFSKKIFFSGVVVVLLVLSYVGILFLVAAQKAIEGFSPRMVYIGERGYVLERAETDIEREKGLGGRDGLCEECGMLFVFDNPGQYAFWMKDMRFPLDIIWLSGDRVVFIANDVQPDFSGIINPTVSADRVIEVNAGVAKSLNPGERMRFSY